MSSIRYTRYNEAMVDITLLKKGKGYETLPDRYTFFITEKDYFGLGEPIYHIQNRIEEMTYAPFGDGSFVLYVNGEYRNTETPIGELMPAFQHPVNQVLSILLEEENSILKRRRRRTREYVQIDGRFSERCSER